MSRITITYPDDNKYEFPLYLKYRGQSSEQPAYLYIDIEDESVWFDCNGECGNAVSPAVWHGRTRRYPTSQLVSSSDMRKFLENKTVQRLITKIVDNYEIVWDGSNLVGRPIRIDATEAEEKLQGFLDRLGEESYYSVWDPEDYFCSEGFHDLVRSGESIYEAAYRLFCEGIDKGVFLNDLTDFLEQRKREIPDACENSQL